MLVPFPLGEAGTSVVREAGMITIVPSHATERRPGAVVFSAMTRCNLQEHDDPMAASIHDIPYTTYLSPGQRFESPDLFGDETGPVTVSRLVRDAFGMMHVTLRTGTGREISAFVQQIEMAITEGHLVPVDSPVAPVAC